jgi:AcrR family transcriptional regulator
MHSDTRAELVESARRLFWEQGYAATGIAQILKQANANSGSLYHFFPTKEDLLLAVLEWYRANLGACVLEPVFARVNDPIERIFGILDGYRRQLLATRFEHGCPIGSLALELCNSQQAARKLIAENFANWVQAVQDCLEAASGRLPADTDTRQLALFILTTMEGAVMLARAYRSIEPYDTAISQLRTYLEGLLRQGSEWSKPRRSRRRERNTRHHPGRVRRDH